MGDYVEHGDTIEGKIIDCITRCWEFKGLKKHPIINKSMSLYSTDRNSEATIIKRLEVDYHDDILEITKHFHREEGDTLKADALSIYVDKKRKITPSVINHSGRHKAQKAHLTDHTIASIATSLDMIKIENIKKTELK